MPEAPKVLGSIFSTTIKKKLSTAYKQMVGQHLCAVSEKELLGWKIVASAHFS